MTANNPIDSKLSTLQLELLKIYAFNPTEEELIEVKNILARYFAHRFTEKMAQVAEAKGITDADLDKWLEEDEQ
ncbi:MAG: hypothetical protein SFU99_00890 [Saprospiraceae bacterium]|nr:hypothetical protein [Saprospiraceae bacterium]